MGVGVVGVLQNAVAAWQPKKPVQFVIMAGKGGGADKMARLMQVVITKYKMSPKPFVPVNKPGGSGAEALVYLKRRTGDDHVIMLTFNSFYITPLRNPRLGINIEVYTPIARMAEDTFLLWVHENSNIKNVKEFVKAAKAKGKNWVMAGTGRGQEDQMLTSLLNSAFGLNMKYVPYKGGGRVAKELAGKNANSTVSNPSEQLGFYQAGKTRPLAAFTPHRLPMFKNVPTFRELGKDYVYFMQRSVVGAPGMSKGAEKFYRDVFKKVYGSAEWQRYMKRKSLVGNFVTGTKLHEYWIRESKKHRDLLKQIGEIK